VKILLFIIIVIFTSAAIFLYMNPDILGGGSNTGEQADKSERCAELNSRSEDKDYNFSYGDRIKQLFKGCL
jgi:hypothetical protein